MKTIFNKRYLLTAIILYVIITLLSLSFIPLFSTDFERISITPEVAETKTELCYDIQSDLPFKTNAKSTILIDMDSMKVLYAGNVTERLGMASTTKIMTALVVLDMLPLTKKITIPKDAIGVEGSSIYLLEGETLTTEELLYGLLLESGNDVATALAIAACGDVDSFVEKMNQKAIKLGLKNTHFSNPHGLSDDNHYTTAEDLAILTAVAMKNRKFREIVSVKKKSISYNGVENGRVLVNHNKLLNTFDGAIGVKTGYTKATGRCLVTAVRRNMQTLIAVTLDCSNDWSIHKQLHDWGFTNYKRVTLAEYMQHSYAVNVIGGEDETVICQNRVDIYTCLSIDSNVTRKIELAECIYAPVYEGDIIGKVTYYADNEIIYVLPLKAVDNVKIKKINFWRKIFNG